MYDCKKRPPSLFFLLPLLVSFLDPVFLPGVEGECCFFLQIFRKMLLIDDLAGEIAGGAVQLIYGLILARFTVR